MPPWLPRLVCPRNNDGGSTKDDDGARPFKVSGQSHLQPQGSKKNLLLLHPLQPLSALQPLAQLQALAVSQVQTLRQLCSAPESSAATKILLLLMQHLRQPPGAGQHLAIRPQSGNVPFLARSMKSKPCIPSGIWRSSWKEGCSTPLTTVQIGHRSQYPALGAT